jgi:hypothetical protein
VARAAAGVVVVTPHQTSSGQVPGGGVAGIPRQTSGGQIP